MKFLDRKEQVLEIELTQYGKHLLSRGVLRPVYYAFFDDDVIYDSQYMSEGSSAQLEYSSNASKRIRESVRPSTQTNYSGVETIFNQISQVRNQFDPILDKVVQIELSLEEKLDIISKPPPAIDNLYSLGLPMGTSEYNSDKSPAWDMKVVRGEITGSVQDYTGSSGLLKIPQIEMEAFYETQVKPLVEGKNVTNVKSNATIFEDGNYIDIKKDYILIDLSEFNSVFENENFDIEVYEITEEQQVTSGKYKETLVPLYFANGTKVTSDVYYSENLKKKINIKETNVEYYFDVRVDEEIQDDFDTGLVGNLYDRAPKNEEEPC